MTGKTVTLTIASPCVVTSTNHGLRDGARLVFSTTGALPTGITAGVTYYAKSTAANTFNLYTDAALTSIVNTSGTQSGTHTAKSVLMAELFAQHPGRWGDAGSERCYDKVYSWQTTRTPLASPFDVEVCELGQAFDDYMGTSPTLYISTAAASMAVPQIDGEWTEAFCAGSETAGYTLIPSVNFTTGNNFTLRGIKIKSTSPGTVVYGNNALWVVDQCVIIGYALATSVGFQLGNATAGKFTNNKIVNCNYGIQHFGYATICDIANNTVTKCNYGIRPYNDNTSNMFGRWFNNLSIGNYVSNWGVQPTALQSASNNAGASGDTIWKTGTNPTIALTTSDLYDYTNGDYRPATASSPQVDAGTVYYGQVYRDITNSEVPNYNNGGAEAVDIGCYEYDHGYGNHPATATISLTNIVSGSRVLITRDDTSAVLYNDVPGASLSFVTGYIGNFSVVIRKASESPYYREFSAGGATVADQTTSIKALQQLDE